MGSDTGPRPPNVHPRQFAQFLVISAYMTRGIRHYSSPVDLVRIQVSGPQFTVYSSQGYNLRLSEGPKRMTNAHSCGGISGQLEIISVQLTYI